MLARSAWMCALASSVAIAGCALDRAGIVATRDASVGRDAGIDAAVVDAGPDAGPLCMVGGCDDGNVCTNDVCNPGIGCVHTPVPGSCDDGVLCNGADSCGEGTCSVHDGVDPCPGSSFCDATTDECMGCEDDGDCPGEMIGDWGACTFPAGECPETGSRSRNVRSYTCSASGTCEASDRVELEACTRETDGTSCMGGTTPGTWSACTYANPMCGESGTRTRTNTVRACMAGTCQSRSVMETDMTGCVRDTDGNTCNSPIQGAWGACGAFSDTCDESGTQSRTVTQPRCAGGTCSGSTMTTETQACTRDTDGTSCGGTPSCTMWSPCAPTTGTSRCSGAGEQTRLCTGSLCAGGSCAMDTRTVETRVCTLGGVCVQGIAECGECQGCPSPTGGYRQCSADTGTCNGGGNCMGDTTATVYESCTCP